MIDMKQRPVMRYVEAIPFEEDGQTFFYIRDPLEIASQPLVVSPAELYILSMFDGQHSPRDIKMEFATQFNGALLQDEHIFNLIDVLEEHHYLNSPAFQDYFRKMQSDFEMAKIRPAWHAGAAYPDDPDALYQQIETFFRQPDGAGLPETNGKLAAKPRENIRAIMAPHIDLRVGGACYTHAYRQLIENSEPADLYIILGVAHYGGRGFFTASMKDFETPLGIVKTDRDFIRKWSEAAGQDVTLGEWAHRIEHSIEFQLPFLQYAFDHEYRIVPVLCGSPEPYLQEEKRLEQHPEIRQAIHALRRLIEEDPRRLQIILSVDLAHMGPKFDQPEPVTEAKAAEIQAADETMFRLLGDFDLDQYYHLMKTDLLPRHVDACSAIYTLFQLLPGCKAKTVGYGQNLQPETQSIVTYGSAVFYDK